MSPGVYTVFVRVFVVNKTKLVTGYAVVFMTQTRCSSYAGGVCAGNSTKKGIYVPDHGGLCVCVCNKDADVVAKSQSMDHTYALR